MNMKPKKLYHGNNTQIRGSLKPILKRDTVNHIHNKASVFATARIDIAALFMFPMDTLASIGFEKDIAYICIWGNKEEFNDNGGFIYVLPSKSFIKFGKEYEWQSFEQVKPIEVKRFKSVIGGMINCGVQVYFINNDKIFDKIVSTKTRSSILKRLISENQKIKTNIKKF